MPMTTSLILRSVDFTKTPKSKNLENETFFLQIIKLITQQRVLYGKNSFVAEVTFNYIMRRKGRGKGRVNPDGGRGGECNKKGGGYHQKNGLLLLTKSNG